MCKITTKYKGLNADHKGIKVKPRKVRVVRLPNGKTYHSELNRFNAPTDHYDLDSDFSE